MLPGSGSIYLCVALLALAFFAEASPSFADDTCTGCHRDTAKGSHVHPAVEMGCVSCHSAVDASKVPHVITNRNSRGLSAKLRDLCFTCHDRAPFQKSTVHGAVLLGCLSCHDPHASDQEHLLKQAIPGLCLGCHEETFRPGKDKGHVLAGNEACLTCHNPHSTDAARLLVSLPAASAEMPKERAAEK